LQIVFHSPNYTYLVSTNFNSSGTFWTHDRVMPDELAMRKVPSRITTSRGAPIFAAVLLAASVLLSANRGQAAIKETAYGIDNPSAQAALNQTAFTHSFKLRQRRSLIQIRDERPIELDHFAARLHTTIAFHPSNGPLSLAPLMIEDRADSTILGIASTYNPYQPGYESGGPETASGETYNPAEWTAAIQTDLRGAFGGVRYGRNYRPTYALVCDGSKRVIVKINDVGPLMPGRVIDLNDRAMRYFDPTMQRGLLRNVSVIPLPGPYWSSGPVDSGALISMAGDFLYEPIR
jgi:rare lipoprotein A